MQQHRRHLKEGLHSSVSATAGTVAIVTGIAAKLVGYHPSSLLHIVVATSSQPSCSGTVANLATAAEAYSSSDLASTHSADMVIVNSLRVAAACLFRKQLHSYLSCMSWDLVGRLVEC